MERPEIARAWIPALVLASVGCSRPGFLDNVSTPTFFPPAGAYYSDLPVTIGCPTSEAWIFYTTNGDAPDYESKRYDGEILVAGDGTAMTIKAFAAKPGMLDSALADASYTVNYSTSPGRLDNSFPAARAGANNLVTSLAFQTDGKIVIGGYFTTYNGINRGRVARLYADGSLDLDFLLDGAGASDRVESIAPQGDDKAVIVGNFWSINYTRRDFIARLWD